MAVAKDIIKKICLLGDPAVGKTSLIRRFVFDMFDDKYITTIGTKVTKKTVEVKAGSPTGQDVKITLLIWDILGQREYARLHPVYYQGAEGALIVCDATRPETIRNLPTWSTSFTKVVGKVPIIFLINKSDLIDMNEFDTVDMESISETYASPFYFTSARTGDNVADVFYEISKLLASRLKS
jgi:small GTP-binding protein